MSFFTSLSTYRNKAIARLNAFALTHEEISETEEAIKNTQTKKEIDILVDHYIDVEFNQLRKELCDKTRNFIETEVNSNPLCCIARYINPNFDAATSVQALETARAKEINDAKRAKEAINNDYDKKIKIEIGKLKFAYFSSDEKENIAKVLRGVFETLEATDEQKVETAEKLLKTNETLYGSAKTANIALAVSIFSFALMFVGIMFMATGFGLPIGFMMQIIGGALAIGVTTGATSVSFFRYCKHADSSDTIPSHVRNFGRALLTGVGLSSK